MGCHSEPSTVEYRLGVELSLVGCQTRDNPLLVGCQLGIDNRKQTRTLRNYISFKPLETVLYNIVRVTQRVNTLSPSGRMLKG